MFEYEKVYPLPSRGFNIKPDFTITLASGKIIYWEHLGKLGNRSYERDWEKRLKIYEDEKLLGNLMTTEKKGD